MKTETNANSFEEREISSVVLVNDKLVIDLSRGFFILTLALLTG